MLPVTQSDLDRYATLCIRVGLDLQEGQPLLVSSSLAGAPLARAAAAQAYRRGSGPVSVLYTDAEVDRACIRHGQDATLDAYAEWKAHALNRAAAAGCAVLSIVAGDPDVYAAEDEARVARVRSAARTHLKPFYEAVGTTALNWSVVSMPIPEWARKVFPQHADAERELWKAVLAAVRLHHDDPVAAWSEHLATLEARAAHLTARAYRALRYRGPGTDLRVGLADGHVWGGARSTAPSGARFVPNLPTEEVFTAPHRDRVDGEVRSTRPLAYNGKVIDGFTLRFAGGKVVEAAAECGETMLRELLDTDEGARRLGEVALVSASNPVARSGLLFYDTLYDENASSHLALGRAYAFTIRDGANMSADRLASRGANDSSAHVDFMIGSAEMDVDGERADGGVEPVMRGGEFVI